MINLSGAQSNKRGMLKPNNGVDTMIQMEIGSHCSSFKTMNANLLNELNQISHGECMRTLEKGVVSRRANRSGGKNPLGILQVKMNEP